MITSEVTPVARDASAIPTKISFVGAPAVGKTTIIKMLQGKTIDGRYWPTQGFDLGRILIENHAIRLFDFGGQKAYIMQYLQQYIFGSEIVFVVTDSTPQNVLTTKELINFIQGIIGEECQIVAIANKQDLPGHMAPNRVEAVLAVPTYDLVATSDESREKLLAIIQRELNVAAERKILQMEANAA
jgi:small GTP-binding protein